MTKEKEDMPHKRRHYLNKMKICAVIPSYRPDEKLSAVISGLEANGFSDIVVVDDGSPDKSVFESLGDRVTLLTHCKNFGKGRGIKTAINYILTERPDIEGIVFADGDNQHRAEDIVSCCAALFESPDSLVLGVRDFSGSDVPKKSRYGNRISSAVFRLFCGITLSDTQTGLRAMSRATALALCDVEGERYEYETNALLKAHSLDIPFKEVSINTVYIEENKSSHFRPLRDGLRIYLLIFKYLSSAIISLCIDLGIFWLLALVLSFPDKISIFIATAAARVISSVANFLMNKNMVFRSKQSTGTSAVKYYTLCIVQMLLSYLGVYMLYSNIRMTQILAKVIVDTLLFFISFYIQREWVFKKRGK